MHCEQEERGTNRVARKSIQTESVEKESSVVIAKG